MSRIQFTVPVVVEPYESGADDDLVVADEDNLKNIATRVAQHHHPAYKALMARELAAKALALALHFEKIDS